MKSETEMNQDETKLKSAAEAGRVERWVRDGQIFDDCEYEHVYEWWARPGYKFFMMAGSTGNIKKGKVSKWYGEQPKSIRAGMTAFVLIAWFSLLILAALLIFLLTMKFTP